MKLSEKWLRTLVNPALDTRALADALTFSGLEVEELEPAAPPLEKVVVGEVKAVEKHPNADRLSVCQVDIGTETLTIVCGAPNVATGMKVPTARVGAKLPALEIRAAKVRGVDSQGMLCSAKELGLSEDAAGLLALPADAANGADLRVALGLDDWVLTTKPTPNRGDCLSMLGVAREVAAITGAAVNVPSTEPPPTASSDRLDVKVSDPAACPRYCGRLIRGVDASVPTPDWMVARLARSGVRAISAVVDITNYVMLELGQPLHAFDASRLRGGITVRRAHKGEQFELLNGEKPELDESFVVIADDERPVALAGIMGGADTAVENGTRDVFLESAFFSPHVIAGKSRRLNFGSDSSYRFERGVDFDGTQRSLDRGTALILQICGGQAGPVTEAQGALPERKPVRVRLDRAARLLGVRFSTAEARGILERLGFTVDENAPGELSAKPPAYRFDIAIEEDLIEELARVRGYDRIPAAVPTAAVRMLPEPEARRSRRAVRQRLVLRDFHEVVTYSFIDRAWEADFCNNGDPVALANPIASQMSVMRSSLIPGLVMSAGFNLRHRQPRIRLFELGRCFPSRNDSFQQPMRIGAVACGEALPMQWGSPARSVDFFDMKGDLEALFAPAALTFEAADHPALHPGKSARVLLGSHGVGWIGELHPTWQRKYDLSVAPLVFEVDLDSVIESALPAHVDIAKVPPVRRDIAALFDQSVSAGAVLDALRAVAPPVVTDLRLFDVYAGKDLENGRKSLAFMVLLQDTRKTLTDAEVESALATLRETLLERFDAKLR